MPSNKDSNPVTSKKDQFVVCLCNVIGFVRYRVTPVFSLILSMTGKINFQTGKAIFLLVEFSRIPSKFKR